MIYIIINEQLVKNIGSDTIDFDIYFGLAFTSTILSAAYALTSQLKLGPCRIMPRDKFGLPFVIIFFSNVFGLLGKGFLLGVLAVYMKFSGFADLYAPMMLIVTSILPPMIFVSKLPIDYFLSLFSLKNF